MRVTLLTDASFCLKTGVAGFGFWISSGRGKSEGGGLIEQETTSPGHAEMQAIYRSMLHIKRRGLLVYNDHLLVQTDCLEAIRIIDGKKTPRTHQSKIDVARSINLMVRNMRIKFRIKHIKGHSKGGTKRLDANRTCDRFAKGHMYKQRKLIYGY